MRTILSLVAAALLGVGLAGCSDSSCCCDSSAGAHASPAAGAKYTCSMDGGQRDTPGPCPKCGMALPEKK